MQYPAAPFPAPSLSHAPSRRLLPGAAGRTAFARRLRGALVSASLLVLAACGGGGSTAVSSSPTPPGAENPLLPPPNPESGPEAIGVYTGFAGDSGWIVTGDGDGGIGAGADGDGGVGAGGSLGRFRNALVYATRDDGTRLGPAVTDPDTGMVTIRPGRTYAGPLLVELVGQAGSEYFDEARNAWIAFPAGERLRTLVPAIRANIGITPLTEAAARMAEQDVQLAQRPLAARASEANERIRGMANSLLPGSYALDDLVRLPVLIGPDSGRGALPGTPAGRLGTVIAALAIAAGQYNPPLPGPGLAMGTQLAADLADGTFNGAGPGGAALGPADQLAYDPMELPGQLVAAIDRVNARYGVDSGDPPLPRTVEFGRYYNFAGRITTTARLLSDGTVLVSTAGAGETALPADPDLPGSALPATALFSDGAGLLIRRSDGSMQAVGTNQHANAQVAYRFGVAEPAETQALVPAAARLSGASGATDVRFGARHMLARTADGAALAWGDNSAMQLGIAGIAASVAPQAVAASGVRAVAASGDFSLAQLVDGRVLSWGTDRPGGLGRGPGELFEQGPGAVLRADGGELTDVVAVAASGSSALALRSDGTVWGWGDAGSGLLGDETQGQRYFAAPVNGLAGIRKLVPGAGGMVALDAGGVVYVWGLGASQQRVLPAPIGGLPPIRDVQDRGAGVTVALGFGDEVFEIGAGGVAR